LRELDTFLWQLVAASLDKKTPPAASPRSF